MGVVYKRLVHETAVCNKFKNLSNLKGKRLENYKYHLVYRTTNLVNNKIYIGLHSTNKLNDGYLGSGWVLKNAIKKHGRENFNREIIDIFSDRKDARTLEAILVDSEFIKRKDTYNLTEGGLGVEDQSGDRNYQFGKIAKNAKAVRAIHKNGNVVEASSIDALSELIDIARGNIRNLLKKQIRGKKGWRVFEFVT